MLFVATFSTAAAPKLDFLYPAGGQRGTTVNAEAGGDLGAWPPKVWTDSPGLEFKAGKTKGKFELTIGSEASYGPHLVRIYNEVGASDLRTFVVGRQEEIAEKEPNDSAQQAQLVKQLPVTINGRLEKSGDLDSYSFELEAGRWLVALVDSFGLGAPVDAHLHLLDDRGVRVALGNDSYNLDPVLAYRIEKAGRYTLQIAGFAHPPKADVRFTGDNASLYRLTITDGPVARHAFPVKGDSPDEILLSGWNLASLGLAEAGRYWRAEKKLLANPGLEPRLRFPPGVEPEQTEQEPKKKPGEAQIISLPGAVNGCLQIAGDEDRFEFTAKAGERFEFRLTAGSLGFPVMAILRLDDQKCKQLSREEMSVTLQDPKITWTAGATGKFFLRVSDLYRHGSEDSLYRLEASKQTPDFNGRTDNQRYRVDPGKSAEIKVTVTRLYGFDEKLVVRVADLPEGVTADDVTVPEKKGGEIKVTLKAAETAKPASQPIRVMVIAEGKEVATRPALFDLRVKNAKTGDPLVTETDNIWLTVPPANTPAASPPAATKK
jgi:hypothetical protein